MFWQSWSDVHEPQVPPLLPLEEPLEDPLDDPLDDPELLPLLDPLPLLLPMPPELPPLEPPLELVLPPSPGESKPGPVDESPEPQAATSPTDRMVAATVCSDRSLMSALPMPALPPRQHPDGFLPCIPAIVLPHSLTKRE